MIRRIGAQTIVWGEDIRDHMDAILTFLAASGFQGVETGIRHFYLDRYQSYREIYQKTGLILLGIHSGGKFWDPDQEAAYRKIAGPGNTAEAISPKDCKDAEC